LITLFKHSNPFALILLLVLATLPEWKGGYETLSETNNIALLYSYFERYLFSLHHQSSGLRILNIILLLVESLFFNKLVSDHRLIEKPGFVPAMTYLLIQAVLPFRIDTFFVLINGLLLIVIKLMIVVYKQDRPSNNLIGAGFVVGLLAAMNTGYWITYLWLITALFIMRPASSKEWLICTLGFLMPFYFILSLEYLNDQLDLKQFFSDFGIVFSVPLYKPFVWLKMAIISILPLIGLWMYSPTIGKMVIQNRKTYLIVIILILVILSIFGLKFGIIAEEIMLILTPASFLIAPIFLSFKKEFIPNLLFFLLIALALIR
jgi:heme exporter protein D